MLNWVEKYHHSKLTEFSSTWVQDQGNRRLWIDVVFRRGSLAPSWIWNWYRRYSKDKRFETFPTASRKIRGRNQLHTERKNRYRFGKFSPKVIAGAWAEHHVEFCSLLRLCWLFFRSTFNFFGQRICNNRSHVNLRPLGNRRCKWTYCLCMSVIFSLLRWGKVESRYETQGARRQQSQDSLMAPIASDWVRLRSGALRKGKIRRPWLQCLLVKLDHNRQYTLWYCSDQVRIPKRPPVSFVNRGLHNSSTNRRWH